MIAIRTLLATLTLAGVATAATDPIATNSGWSDQPSSPQAVRLSQAPDLAGKFRQGVLGEVASTKRRAKFVVAIDARDSARLRRRLGRGWTFTPRSSDPQWRPAGCEGLVNTIVGGRWEVYEDDPADILAARGSTSGVTGRDQVVAYDLATGTFSWLLPVPNNHHYWGTFRVSGTTVEVPYSPLASASGSGYSQVWLRRFDLATRTTQDVQLPLQPGDVAFNVYLDTFTYDRTRVSVSLDADGHATRSLAVATPDVPAPLEPFNVLLKTSRMVVVNRAKRPVTSIPMRRMSAQGTQVWGRVGRAIYAEAIVNFTNGAAGLGVMQPTDRWDWALRYGTNLTVFVAGVASRGR